LPIGPSGNLQIPLANGNIMKIPLTSINISEEVNKSGVWKQVNEDNGIVTKETKTSPTKSRFVQFEILRHFKCIIISDRFK